jgi:hypothetical protein
MQYHCMCAVTTRSRHYEHTRSSRQIPARRTPRANFQSTSPTKIASRSHTCEGRLQSELLFLSSVTPFPGQAALKEALRLHPCVAHSLECYGPPEGTLICGVNLSCGANVSMSAPVVHMDDTGYRDNAGSLRPERRIEADPAELKLIDRSIFAISASRISNAMSQWALTNVSSSG